MRQLTRTILVTGVAMLLLVACGEDNQPPVDIDATVEARVGQALTALPTLTAVPTATSIELDAAMEEKLLTLANNRDAWFLASDITAESLEGLYGSWSVICRNETSLADYKGTVYEVVRPWVLEMLKMELKDVQKAKRYYKVESWSPPGALVEQTWKLGDKIVLGPERQLYLIESDAWRYYDC